MDATIVGREARDVGYTEDVEEGLYLVRWDQDDMPVMGEVVEVEHDGRAVGRVTINARRWEPANLQRPAHWRAIAYQPRKTNG